MKLITLIPGLGLLLFVLVLLSVFYACSPGKKAGPVHKEMDIGQEPAGNVVHRSVELSGNAYKVVNEIANGIQSRGIGECLVLNIDGFHYHGEQQVAIHVFLNKKDADSSTSKKSEHFVASFIVGHKHGEEEKGQNYTFGMDKAVETLGDTLLADLDPGALDINLVAYPVFGDAESIKNVSFTVDAIHLDVKCD